MVVPFLRAEDRRKNKLAEKDDAFLFHKFLEVPMRQPSQDARVNWDCLSGVQEAGAGYPIPIDADRYVVHLLIPWWLRR